MSFALTVLGSSSALPTAKRFTTAQVLNVHERFFLIDCGEGAQIQLRKFGVNMSKIKHVLISHLHGDHVFGIFGLFSSYNLMGRKTDLHVYAHGNFDATLKHFLEYFGKDLSYRIIFHPFAAWEEELIYEDRHLTIRTIPLRHGIPVAGFMFREKEKMLNIRKEVIEKYGLSIRDIRKIKEGQDFVTGEGKTITNKLLTLPPYRCRSYAFCTDTSYFRRLELSLKDIDLLYFETTFADNERKLAKETGHTTSVQAAKLARNANVGRLLMGHFSTRYKSVDTLLEEARAIFPNSFAVEDGERYDIEQVRKSR